MATVQNARDALLQAAPSRYSNPVNAAIILAASAPIFKIPASGGADPAALTFTASLLELAGPVSFVVTGCTVSVSGNVATLTYANMPGVTATVKATLTENGQTYNSNVCSITKIADGTSGAGTPGVDGARGAGQYYAAGSAWSDAAADATTPGGNVAGDTVTISNGTSFIQVRQWNGSAWVLTTPVYDGGAIFKGTVTANKIDSNGLSIRRIDGTLILDAGGGGLQPGFEAPGTKNSDLTPSIGAAQADADAANAAIYDMGSDGILSPSEKPAENARWNAIVAEYPGLYAQGTAFTLITARNNYKAAYDALEAYLNSIGYANFSAIPGTPITIDGPTYRAKFQDYYTKRQALVSDFDTVAKAAGDGAQVAADAANAALDNKLNKNADDILGGVLSINAVTAPAGFRAGNLTWNASGARTGGYGIAMTPQGLIGYNSAGTLTFFINANTGDPYFAGQLAAAYGSFGAVTIASGGSISSGQTAFNTGNGFHLSYAGGYARLSLGNSAGAYLTYDGSTGLLRLSGQTYDPFSLSIPNFFDSGGAGVRYFSITATPVGGKAPFKYQWTYVSDPSEPGISIQSGSNAATLNLACINKSIGTSASGTAHCSIIDADNRAVTASCLVEQQY
jgi:hypothetical protein